MKAIAVLSAVLLAVCATSWAEEHATFTALLKAHVTDGEVDYRQLCADPRLTQYLQQLQGTDPLTLSVRDARLAFWINVYNAYTLKLICDHYPVASINELHKGGLIIGSVIGQTAWDRKIVKVKDEVMTLGHVEHKIIRPEFQDARIHFAVVCAARGCPPLRSQAYEPDRLNAQLDEQGRIFLADPQKNRFDTVEKIAHISPIFSWFKADFGGRPAEVLAYLAAFMPEPAREALRKDPRGWRIRYTFYDWALNEKRQEP